MNEEIPYNPPGMDEYIREGARKNTELFRKMGILPTTPKTGAAKAVGSSALLAALQRRFLRNSQIEKKTAKLMRKKYKAILAHDATIRSETWFCAANIIGDELAANDQAEAGGA